MTTDKKIKFAIFTHVTHSHSDKGIFAYAPYVNEMNIWAKYVSEMVVVAPLNFKEKTAIDSYYNHQKIILKSLTAFNFKTLKSTFKAISHLPKTIFLPRNKNILKCQTSLQE